MSQTPGRRFTKPFTQQEPIPEAGIERAIELMRSGRLHRYNTVPGEISEVALFEKEFAEYLGSSFCAAFSSCGSSIYVALKSVGVKPGDSVLCNAFTLAPVPGAIENAGAAVVLVEIKEDFTIDLADLEQKIAQSGARFFLISHMRGHIADMDAVERICRTHAICLIEDCAHTMGCKWGDRYTGTFGQVACFSTQTYKHMNSGEGGLLVTNDADVIAKAILYSGSYMLYESHLSRPPVEIFEKHKSSIPNFSLRMSNLQAALLRPQLKNLDENCRRWNDRYAVLQKALSNVPNLSLPERPDKEHYVGSSFQFMLKGLSRMQVENFLKECGLRGVEIKWFGGKEPKGFTSTFKHWQYIGHEQHLPETEKILDCLCDFRVPLTFSLQDCEVIAEVIREVMAEITATLPRP